MTKKRGFEIAKGFENQGINLPIRATKNAAGYDFEAAEKIVIPSIIKNGGEEISKRLMTKISFFNKQEEKKSMEELGKILKPVLVPTGIKAYMGDDEYLQLTNRSSNPLKKFLLLSNGVGVIDSDYYNNIDNDGHIMFQFINFGLLSVVINKGDRIGQGIFLPFLKVDNDTSEGERVGGHGSTNVN